MTHAQRQFLRKKYSRISCNHVAEPKKTKIRIIVAWIPQRQSSFDLRQRQ